MASRFPILLNILTIILVVGSLLSLSHYRSTQIDLSWYRECPTSILKVDCATSQPNTSNSMLLLYACILLTIGIVATDIVYFVKLRKLPKYLNTHLPMIFKSVDVGLVVGVGVYAYSAKYIVYSGFGNFLLGLTDAFYASIGFIFASVLTGVILIRKSKNAPTGEKKHTAIIIGVITVALLLFYYLFLFQKN